MAYQANRGVTVRQPPNLANRDFIVSLRQQIECYAIRAGMVELRAHGLDAIETQLRDLERACEANDAVAVAHSDVAFHEAILVACGAEDFLPVWKWLCAQMLLTYTRLQSYEQVLDEHVQIFRALQSGKKQVTMAAIKANIR